MTELDEPCPTCGRTPCLAQTSTVAPAERCVLPHRWQPCRPRRAADGGYVCAGHRTGLARQLLELPGMDEALVAMHNHGGGSSEIRAGGHAGLDLKDRVARARAELRTMLATWCRAIAKDRGFTPPEDTLPDMARWLVGHRGAMLDWICAHVDDDATEPVVVDFHAGIDAVHREAWNLLHPGRNRHVTIAICGTPLWTDVLTRVTVVCTGALVVSFRGDDLDRYPDAVCDDCGRQVPPVRWLRLANRDLRLSVVELAMLWSVPLPTVKRWARDWVSDGDRPARYSVAEAERTLKRYRPETEGETA